MPNQNFSNFAERTTGLLNSDFIVGYDPAGPLEFRTTIGNLLSGGTASEKIQYTMAFTHSSSIALADNVSYYFGQGPVDLGLVTAAVNTRSIFAAGTGKIKYASVCIFASTIGSSESVPVKVANITDTTEALITNVSYAGQNQGNLYTLSTPMLVSQSDQICIKVEVPLMATNPSAVRHMVTLYVV
jgi:hypothetical protein